MQYAATAKYIGLVVLAIAVLYVNMYGPGRYQSVASDGLSKRLDTVTGDISIFIPRRGWVPIETLY